VASHFPQYGPIIGGYNIDKALIATFKKWYRSYLNETARQNDESFARLASPRSYRSGAELKWFPEDQRPCVIVVNNGYSEPPHRSGQGSDGVGQRVQLCWEYLIGVQIVAQGGRNQLSGLVRAHELAMMYIAAARVMLQNIPIEGMDNLAIDLKDEVPGDIEPDGERTMGIGTLAMNVTVPQAHIWGTAPLQPEPEIDPPADIPVWPEVTDPKHITIIKVPTGGE
jgi:hypothetical protein